MVLIPLISGKFFYQSISWHTANATCLNPFDFREVFLQQQRVLMRMGQGLNPFDFREVFLQINRSYYNDYISLNPFDFREVFLPSLEGPLSIAKIVLIPLISGKFFYHKLHVEQPLRWLS